MIEPFFGNIIDLSFQFFFKASNFLDQLDNVSALFLFFRPKRTESLFDVFEAFPDGDTVLTDLFETFIKINKVNPHPLFPSLVEIFQVGDTNPVSSRLARLRNELHYQVRGVILGYTDAINDVEIILFVVGGQDDVLSDLVNVWVIFCPFFEQ